jgi:hypothetical protein
MKEIIRRISPMIDPRLIKIRKKYNLACNRFMAGKLEKKEWIRIQSELTKSGNLIRAS